MSEISFFSLGLKQHEGVNTFKFNDKIIEVKEYLPAEEKNNLIQAVMQNANTGSVFNTFAVDLYLNLYLVMYYTNITFSDEELEDLPKLYDILESSGFIDVFIENLSDIEYNIICEHVQAMQSIIIQYNTSVKKVIDTIEQFAPDTAERISKELNDFDINKYEQVVNIARGAGAQI